MPYSINEVDWAYICGFAFADGSTHKGKYNYVELASADSDVIEKLAEVLSQKSRIFVMVRANPLLPIYRLVIIDEVLRKKFWESGLRPAKSRYWFNPVMDDGNFWNWLRGFTDGAGCIGRYNGRVHIQWAFGPKLGAEWLRGRLSDLVGIKSSVTRCGTSWSLHVTNIMAEIILRNMYEGSKLFMDRKMAKYREIMG